MAIDEFGVERVPGEPFRIAPDSDEKYILDTQSHKIIPDSVALNAVKRIPHLAEKYRSIESTQSVTDDLMKDFLGFYGGSVSNTNFFEWSYYKQRLMIERSHEESQKGVGKAIKDIITNFAIGSGVTYEYVDPLLVGKSNELRERINYYINTIWEDNHLERLQFTISDFIVDRGEVFIKMVKLPNKVSIELIDPIEMVDYLYDANLRKPVVWLRSYYRGTEYIMKEPLLTNGGIDPHTGCPYKLFHWKFNVPETLNRGRSDMYSVLFWLKLYNDFLKCRSRLNRFRSSVAWHKKVAGGDRAISSAGTRIQKPFPPGTVIVTDDKTSYEALEANIDAGDVKDDADAFKTMIASTIQIPHHWLFGSGENTNLATAKNMSSVPKRRFLRRQQDMIAIFKDIIWEGLAHLLKKDQKDAARRIAVISKIYPRHFTNELKTKIMPQEQYDQKLVLTHKSTLEEITEAVGTLYKNPMRPKTEILVGLDCIKRKHLRIVLPPVDEENAEDILRKARTVDTLRAAGIGSNHALYKIMGIDYRTDQELLEREIKRGDYSAIGTAKRLIAASKDPNDVETGQMIAIDPADTNNDGVVSGVEQPDETFDGIPPSIDLSKKPSGGA